ncbi:hypothetical protein S7335_4621 [Synechococcus sp. PCC 7335]|nr:hypothetical protein S7335_4621 [Synechococcus sp. PCC 7335]
MTNGNEEDMTLNNVNQLIIYAAILLNKHNQSLPFAKFSNG